MTGLVTNGWFWTGAGVLLVIAGLVIVWLRIDTRHEREGADLFPRTGRHRALEPAPEREPDALDELIAEYDEGLPQMMPAPVPATALEPLPPAPAVPPPAAACGRHADADRLGALIGVPHLDTAALVEEMAARAYGHHGSARLTELSNWRKADGLALAEAVRNG